MDLVELTIPREEVNDERVLLVEWYVEDEGFVGEGGKLYLIETSKSVVQVDASTSGYVRREVDAGLEVAVGARVAWLAKSLDSLPGKVNHKSVAVNVGDAAKHRRLELDAQLPSPTSISASQPK